MNAYKFINDFSLEGAKKILKNNYDTHFCSRINDYTDGYDEYELCKDCVVIQELKQAIDDFELVLKWGGYPACLDCIHLPFEDFEGEQKLVEYAAKRIEDGIKK